MTFVNQIISCIQLAHFLHIRHKVKTKIRRFSSGHKVIIKISSSFLRFFKKIKSVSTSVVVTYSFSKL